MEKKIGEGHSLTKAMEESALFPEYALRMIEAGESTGKLEDVLKRLSSYYREQNTIRERLRSVLIYPAAIVSIITVTFYLVGNAFSDACDPRNHV